MQLSLKNLHKYQKIKDSVSNWIFETKQETKLGLNIKADNLK